MTNDLIARFAELLYAQLKPPTGDSWPSLGKPEQELWISGVREAGIVMAREVSYTITMQLDSPETIKKLMPVNTAPAAYQTIPAASVPVIPTSSSQTGKQPKTAKPNSREKDKAKLSGYTGSTCSNCLGIRMIRSGTCETCSDCGQTSGCS